MVRPLDDRRTRTMTVTNRAVFLAILALGGCAASPTPAVEPATAGTETPPAISDDAGPAPADGAPATAPEPAACDLAGTWQGPIPGGHFRGEALTWVIGPDGATESTFGPARVRSATTLTGGEIQIVDREATPAMVACQPDPPGRYAAAFGEGCATLTLTPLEDPCNGRRDCLSGLTLTRR
jgi:hypothetical protein